MESGEGMRLLHFRLQDRHRVRADLVYWSSWLLLVGMAGYLLSIRITADATWWGTLLAFLPRWPWVLPLLFLSSIAVLKGRWRALALQGVTCCIFLWPVMGFRHAGVWKDCPPQKRINLRILSANLQGDAVAAANLTKMIAELSPDFVALQECPHELPEELFDSSWSVETQGQLCLASRYPIVRTEVLDRRDFGGWGSVALIGEIVGPDGLITIACLHLSTVRPGLEAMTNNKLGGIRELEAVVEMRRKESEAVVAKLRHLRLPLIIAGDFNMPVDSVIYRSTWSNFSNAFSTAGFGLGFTKYTRWHGVRIDHILIDSDWEVICCKVGPNLGSDHLPLVAELRLLGRTVDKKQW